MDAAVYKETVTNVHNTDGFCGTLQQMFLQLQANIESKIDAYQRELDQRINTIEARLSSIRSDHSINVDQLLQSVENVRQDAAALGDKLGEVNNAKELIVTGIPYHVDEDLNVIYRRIAKHLGYNDAEVPLVELVRLAKPKSSPPLHSPIVCRFAHRGSRHKFFHNYLANLSLCLADIGYPSKDDGDGGNINRIFINENLSNRARNIRKIAIKMKKAGLVQKVLVRDGVIFVKLADKDSIVPCYSKQSLLDKLNLSI